MNEKILEKINETIDLGNPSFNERIANAFDYLEKKKKYTLADKFLHNVLNDVDILDNCLHCSFLSMIYNNEEDKIILLILCAFNIVNVDEELDNPNSLYKGTHLSTSVKDKFFKFLDKGNVDMTINCKSCDSLQKTIWENIKEEELKEEKQNVLFYDIIKPVYKNEKLVTIIVNCYNYLLDMSPFLSTYFKENIVKQPFVNNIKTLYKQFEPLTIKYKNFVIGKNIIANIFEIYGDKLDFFINCYIDNSEYYLSLRECNESNE